MKTKLLTLVLTTLLAALTLGQTDCDEQVYLPLTDCPYSLDPNQIAVHPVSGERLYLGWTITDAGRPWSFSGYACDPDGDPVTITSAAGTVQQAVDPNGFTVYTVSGIAPEAIGTYYINVTATDEPMAHQEPLSVTGTRALIVTPANRHPIFCGGTPGR